MAPRSTRRRAVVSFVQKKELISISDSSTEDFDKAARVNFTSVSVVAMGHHRLTQQSSPGSHTVAQLAFWVDENVLPVFDCCVEYPTNWSPRIYLAALKVSILFHNSCLCDS
jgi:hypothetical protein